MPKARLVFDGDNVYIGKDARIYNIKSDIASKIDGIPGVINSLDSTSTTDALSANMGRDLQDQINAMSGIGKFLSTWDCTTGLPGTNPQEDPYTYKVGDYYVVSVVGVTNYKPHGATYTQGVASQTVETDNVGINDKYYYDGADWVRVPNTAIQISIDNALSTTSTNAVENRVVTNALNGKQATISDLATIRSGAAAGATALQALDNISELTNNVGYQTAGDVNSAIQTAIGQLPTVNDGVLTIQKNSTTIDTFSANSASNKTINIGVPTTVAELSDANDYATKTYVDGAIDGLIHEGSTAPLNPQEGDLWYDTVNHVLKIYNGTNWETVDTDTDTTYTAGYGIIIGTYNDYSAMRGPCPDGYHIPTSDEWTAIKTAWIDLGGGEYDGNDFGMYLKLPYAGYRHNVTAYPSLQNMMGEYRSVTVNGNNVKRLSFNEDGIYPSSSTNRSYALPIRPFKDTPVVPDSSWTTLYSGSGDAGIFHNYTLGLISISGDGTNWITMADKNLGASLSWNYGDTLAETNCGKYYQWGNNYGFPFTGDITTSTTIVDATGYGPGNYYNNSTFIKTSASPYDWSNPKNDNLRGGVTGVVVNNNAISINDTIVATQSDIPTTVAELSDSSDYATKVYVDNAVSGAISSGNTAPANPVAGQIWYDTVNNVLKVYNGTSWEIIDINVVSDTVFSASWDGDTTHAPSKNAIYDVLGDVETLLANL